jgi:hypothetical protein
MRGRLLVAALAVLCIGSVPASTPGDRLEPEQPSHADDYEQNLRIVLRDAYATDVRLRAIVRPSFEPEYAVGLRRIGGRDELFSLVPARMVWHYSLIKIMKGGQIRVLGPGGGDRLAQDIRRLKKGLPKRPADLPIERCAVEVDATFAAALTAAWRSMLMQVEPRESDEFGVDGTSYHFSVDVEGRTLAGQVWEPEPETRAGKLAAAADAIRSYCRTRDPESARRILALAAGLAN